MQMAYLFSEGDVLTVMSASGNSPNIVNAVEFAKKMGGKTIGFVGFDGGKLRDLCDHVIHVKSQNREYGPVEDIHLVLDHMITSYLILYFLSEKEKP
jgi:D-sedoheptulose 7-phosphate isomerase